MQAIKSIPKLFLSPLAEFKVPKSPDEHHIGCHNASHHCLNWNENAFLPNRRTVELETKSRCASVHWFPAPFVSGLSSVEHLPVLERVSSACSCPTGALASMLLSSPRDSMFSLIASITSMGRAGQKRSQRINQSQIAPSVKLTTTLLKNIEIIICAALMIQTSPALRIWEVPINCMYCIQSMARHSKNTECLESGFLVYLLVHGSSTCSSCNGIWGITKLHGEIGAHCWRHHLVLEWDEWEHWKYATLWLLLHKSVFTWILLTWNLSMTHLCLCSGPVINGIRVLRISWHKVHLINTTLRRHCTP